MDDSERDGKRETEREREGEKERVTETMIRNIVCQYKIEDGIQITLTLSRPTND